jgi:N4-gp56 family major capsid protein
MSGPNDTGQRSYNAPPGSPSSIGPQIRTDYYQKKALIEMRKTQFFGQMADVTSMPKNFGKTIKKYHYLPLLDDANVNDQGIDAAGIIADGTIGMYTMTIALCPPEATATGIKDDPGVSGDPGFFTGMGTGWVLEYFVGEAVAIVDATTIAQDKAVVYINMALGTTFTNYTEALYGTGGAVGTVVADGWIGKGGRYNDSIDNAVPNTGNLYGSSKDVGTISGKMPVLSEHGGRVNRVGFKRVELEGTLEKFGFFDEYTQESLDFDTDSELEMHIHRETMNGANEITEDALQIDLLNSAGVIRFGGEAMASSELTGEVGAVASEMTYEDLMRLSIELDDNRCPKNTKIITGSRMIDTKTIYAARYMYIGSELIPMVKKMVDLHGLPAFIPTHKYGAAGGTLAIGEIGAVDQFRIIVVPEMMHWEGAGAPVVDNAGFRETGGAYDVFPMITIGSDSFTTIGFQTDGKSVKFKIKNSKPGSDMSYGQHDPYGEIGFMSIKWYYGFMVLRPEWIALCKVVASW